MQKLVPFFVSMALAFPLKEEANEEAARLARLEEEAADLLPDYWDLDGEEGCSRISHISIV